LEWRNRDAGQPKWAGTIVDIVFGSNAKIRALTEVYACRDLQQTFVRDFAAA
jgi:catalase-peroxidase